MLSIANLSVSIDQKPIVRGLSLDVLPGTVHALMGPNGSGKSTLAYTLMGHPAYAINSGQITLHGQSILDLSPDKRAKLGLFLAFQQPLEVPGVSVLSFLKEAYQAVTGNQISVPDFTALVQHKMQLLNLDPSYMYRNLNEGFSGGEKKRLELLQMLILNPKLVILDEIDSGLDIDALKLVAQAINSARQANPNMAILIITHYQRILHYLQPDYVHIVHNGTIVKSGTAALAHDLESKGYDGIVAN